MKVFDLHQDLLYYIIDNPNNVSILNEYKNLNIDKFVFAIFPFRGFYKILDVEEPLIYTLRGIEIAYEIEKEFNLKIIKGIEEFDEGNIILAVEGLYFVRSTYEVRIMNRLGIKVLGLVWNKDNLICPHWNSKNDYGLTDLGYDVVKTAISLNMTIDLSHASDRTFFNVIENFKQNIFVSHTGIREISNIKRNVSEDMIYEISKINGIVGIAFADIFLSKATLTDIAKYVSKLIEKYPNTLCIGSDFYGISQEHKIENLSKPNDLKNLYLELKKYLPDEYVNNFFYNNAYSFFKRALKFSDVKD
ncbi:MAG: membrane dipeptidase [candidate division WOR-3 bacterium]|nr:membrane dipeptidase [candidate division WOR-3 bacterium]MCX7947318.1 membrane dipeptidase [candidate division WOR-3 bacterium]MDW8150126.1 membrane dipeptidase [candidate division WOR-3 bacterium]